MHRFLLLFGLAISPALASLYSVTCDGVTTQSNSSVSCSSDGGGASVTAVSYFRGYPLSPYHLYVPPGGPFLDVTAWGDATASFTGSVRVDARLPEDGYFAPVFIVSGATSVSFEGVSLPTNVPFPTPGPNGFQFSNIPPFAMTANVSHGSVELAGMVFWDISCRVIEPTYFLSDAGGSSLATPEPSGTFLAGLGGLLILASRRKKSK